MSSTSDNNGIGTLNGDCVMLLQATIDTQSNLIVLLHNHLPVLINKAFQDFCGFKTVRELLREFGPFENRFVPHDAYFHAGKAANPSEWAEALTLLPENERIVSMINFRAEPFAFSVTLNSPVEDYTIVSFTDISQDLIKRIMIENDVSIDKESGAFNKDYFIHTAKSFQDAAAFNEKKVGITMIEMITGHESPETLREFTLSLKSNIRQSDMLVRWDKKLFLIAYLVDSDENAHKFSHKLFTIMSMEPFESLKPVRMRLGTSVQHDHEAIIEIIDRAQEDLRPA